MSRTKKVYITSFFLLWMICLSVLAMILLVQEDSSVKNDNLSSSPVSNTKPTSSPENVIRIDNIVANDYKFAAITKQDTLAIFKQDGTKLDINLTKSNWSNINWALGGEFIAVQSTSSEIKDIGIFNFEKKSLKNFTEDFSNGNTVEDYKWIPEKAILFTSQVENENWLNKLNADTDSEILKLFKISGQISSVSSDGTKIILKPQTEEDFWKVIDLDAKILFESDKEETFSESLINSIEFDSSGESIFINSTNKLGQPRNYLFDLTEAQLVSLLTPFGFKPICALETGKFLGYTEVNDGVTFYLYQVNESTEKELVKFTDAVGTVDIDTISCLTENAILVGFTDVAGNKVWNTLDTNGILNKIDFLTGMKDVKLNPNFKNNI